MLFFFKEILYRFIILILFIGLLSGVLLYNKYSYFIIILDNNSIFNFDFYFIDNLFVQTKHYFWFIIFIYLIKIRFLILSFLLLQTTFFLFQIYNIINLTLYFFYQFLILINYLLLTNLIFYNLNNCYNYLLDFEIYFFNKILILSNLSEYYLINLLFYFQLFCDIIYYVIFCYITLFLLSKMNITFSLWQNKFFKLNLIIFVFLALNYINIKFTFLINLFFFIIIYLFL